MTKTLPPSPSFRPKRSGVEKSPPLMVRAALRREISRLRVSSKRFPSAPYRHAAPLEMTVLTSSIQSFQKGTNLILVISTEAGQPPIGKPLIVQARGQLRLTWRLYAESPQSGEIYFLQWYMKHGEGRSLGSEYHGSVSHLSLIPARSPARDDVGQPLTLMEPE